MNTRPSLLLIGVTAVALSIGASGAATASTETTEPSGSGPTHTEHTPVSLAVDGSAEPTSPEAEAFCAAEVAVEAALGSEDEAVIGPAVEAVTATAEPVGLAETVGALAGGRAGQPGVRRALRSRDRLHEGELRLRRGQCRRLGVQFRGLPSEVPAGPAIFTLENAGEQVHDIFVMRLDDDVTLSASEIEALPKDEVMTIGTLAAFAFAFPGTLSYATADLAPGRHVTVCLVFDGATPEVLMQLQELGVNGPDDTIPPDTGSRSGIGTTTSAWSTSSPLSD